jgi:hypothetical protein
MNQGARSVRRSVSPDSCPVLLLLSLTWHTNQRSTKCHTGNDCFVKSKLDARLEHILSWLFLWVMVFRYIFTVVEIFFVT